MRKPETQLTSGLFDSSPLAAEIVHERLAIERGYKRLMRMAKDAVDKGRGGRLVPAERIAGQWFNDVHRAVLAAASGETAQHEAFARAIKAVGSRHAVALALMEVMSAAMKWKVTAYERHVVSRLAQAMQAQANHRVLKSMYLRDISSIDGADARRKAKRKMLSILSVRDRGTINKIARRHAAEAPADPWWCVRRSLMAAAQVLVEIVTKTALIEVRGVVKPAFRRGLHMDKKGNRVRRSWRLYFDDDLLRKLAHDLHSRAALRPVCPPMIVPPLPWADDRAGGYAIIRKPMVARSNKTIKAWHAKHDISVPRSRLNLMSQTPWTINTKNIDVYDRLRIECPNLFLGQWDEKEVTRWRSGIPSVPPDDDPLRPPFPFAHKYADIQEAKRWYRSAEGRDWRKSQDGRDWRRLMHVWREAGNKSGSLRYGFIARLNEVRECAKHERIWLPHHFDFRGRAQPMCTYVTHHGDDFMRGTLLFAEAKPLTEKGWREFSKHCANMWGNGKDKAPQAEQARFTEEFGDFMRQVADDPVANRGWFDAEEPWQFLACCFALVDPEMAARLPRQRDATCNGLQHAAALVRDPVGALASNLVYTGVRQSAYQQTADNLRTILDKSDHPAAADLEPFADDKLCKSPFMTDYYGSTMMGKAKQIYENLRKRGVPDGKAWQMRKFATGAITEAIDMVCPFGRAARDWITECAFIVANGTDDHPGECFRWYIPGWLPVVQPYRTEKSQRISVIGHRFRVTGYSETSPPNKIDQIRGAAPNVVHWIDGQHAMMVAERCAEDGIAMATVFDSFWTHMETGEDALFIILDTFVELHCEPILQRLYEFWCQEYPWATFPPPPPMGKFDIGHAIKAHDAFR